MPLTLEQRDLLAVVDSRSREAIKKYSFASVPAAQRVQRLAEMTQSVLELADALHDDLDADTREALALSLQVNSALVAAALHATEAS